MTTQTKVPKKVVASPAHPSFKEMVISVMKSLKAKSKDRKGQSLRTIVQEISAKYKVNPNNYETHTKLCLKRLLVDGSLEKVKGVGLGGSFKLGASQTETSKKKTKPKSPTKTAAKKPIAATIRKPAAAKKPAVSAKKPIAKKPAPKKPSPAKPKAKESPKKTAKTTKPATKAVAKVKKTPGRKTKTPKKAAAKKT